MIPPFGRPVAQLCMIFNQVVDIIDHQWGRVLTDVNHPLLSPGVLQLYAEAIYRKSSALNNVLGFIDGTTKGMCKTPVIKDL